MINNVEFERLIEEFESNFSESYNDRRKTILYNEVSWLDVGELKSILDSLIKRHNENDLPSIYEIKKIAHNVSPEAVYFSEIEKKAIG